MRYLVVLITLFSMVLVCVADAQDGSPKLYSSSFESLNEEHWTFQTQPEGIKPLKVTADGELTMLTAVDSPSRGEVSSVFIMSGDFDFEVDFYFKLDILNRQIDQYAFVSVREADQDSQKASSVVFQLYRMRGFNPNTLISYMKKSGKLVKGEAVKSSLFSGAVRFRRSGKKLSVLIQTEDDPVWTEFGKFDFSSNDIKIAFGLGNFLSSPNGVKPDGSVKVIYDNFWINSAQKISH